MADFHIVIVFSGECYENSFIDFTRLLSSYYIWVHMTDYIINENDKQTNRQKKYDKCY